MASVLSSLLSHRYTSLCGTHILYTECPGRLEGWLRNLGVTQSLWVVLVCHSPPPRPLSLIFGTSAVTMFSHACELVSWEALSSYEFTYGAISTFLCCRSLLHVGQKSSNHRRVYQEVLLPPKLGRLPHLLV